VTSFWSAGQSDSDEEELENFNLVCQERTPPGWFVVKTPGKPVVNGITQLLTGDSSTI
jgi:hypothetical protein